MFNTIRTGPKALLLAALGGVAACQTNAPGPNLSLALSDTSSYSWSLRASHADQMWVGVGDSLDVVLLRARCIAGASYLARGCWADEDSSVTPGWGSPDSALTVTPLPRGRWLFGAASAGARIFGHRVGSSPLTVTIPQGRLADSVRVVPRFDRLRIEPRDTLHFVGDTIWFRVQGLSESGELMAYLPWPGSIGRPIGPSREDGSIPIAFETPMVRERPSRVVFNIGSKADTLYFNVLPRPGGAAPGAF